jgi:hypothetical protein
MKRGGGRERCGEMKGRRKWRGRGSRGRKRRRGRERKEEQKLSYLVISSDNGFLSAANASSSCLNLLSLRFMSFSVF